VRRQKSLVTGSLAKSILAIGLLLREVGSNRTVMLPNSVQQRTRDGLESDTLAADYIDSD
jgi:hypothetical protein